MKEYKAVLISLLLIVLYAFIDVAVIDLHFRVFNKWDIISVYHLAMNRAFLTLAVLLLIILENWRILFYFSIMLASSLEDLLFFLIDNTFPPPLLSWLNRSLTLEDLLLRIAIGFAVIIAMEVYLRES